ncbi:hypothetical protein [Alienimonas californiensis]|uniref:Uncharacterized protein n=1 Tax=Alienimonas californiensis TaxID=2527989 RepID=A0A517PCV2_9PLAN|nr:hypothetical protein [Alienimonas californiensis]QDT17213.1 hypothetical protein CA12_33250 [Alienimonas californiensis]
MLKLNAGLSRKIGQPDYGSRGAMVNVEVELSAELLKDPEKLRRQIRGCFEVIREAIDAELGVTDGPAVRGVRGETQPAAAAHGAAARNGTASAAHVGNGRTTNGSLTNGALTNSRGSLPCTEKQVRALHAFS